MWSHKWTHSPEVMELRVQCVKWMIGEDFGRLAVSLNAAYNKQFVFSPAIFYSISLNLFGPNADKLWSDRHWRGFAKDVEAGIQGDVDIFQKDRIYFPLAVNRETGLQEKPDHWILVMVSG